MSHSVKISTPFPSPEDIAFELGIKGRRLNDLLALAERPFSSRKKAVRKKAPIKRVNRGRGSKAN